MIHREHVITSAQCVMSVQNRLISPFWLQVIAGDVNIVGTITSTSRIERSVTHIFVHPNYNIFSRNNDLAVLRISQPIPEFHNTIDVAQRNLRLLPDASACRLVAWGALTAVSNHDNIIHTIAPAATGENKRFNNPVRDVLTENAVIAISPITLPSVPASVARRPKIWTKSTKVDTEIIVKNVWKYYLDFMIF